MLAVLVRLALQLLSLQLPSLRSRVLAAPARLALRLRGLPPSAAAHSRQHLFRVSQGRQGIAPGYRSASLFARFLLPRRSLPHAPHNVLAHRN